MRSIQTEAVNARQEFTELGIQIIRRAIVQFFVTNPHVYALSFRLDFTYSGHEYEETSRVWDFKAKLEPNSPNLGNDLDNYVEVSTIYDKTLLRDSTGSMALILRELRPSAIKLFGDGFVILKREDWLPNQTTEQLEIPYCN